MKIGALIEALRRPAAYPHPVDSVEVRQTHISAVFLAGSCAYKVKKPVNLGFLDFTTAERRLHDCKEEVRLNRRLAPRIYVGVVPVTATPDGGAEIEGRGPVVEHAVKMRRLPDDATLEALLAEQRPVRGIVERLGRRIARFHRDADAGPEISRYGRWNVVASNARENLEQSGSHVGDTVSREVHGRLADLLEARLVELRPLMEARARRGMPRDTHGDLHLEHVYVLPDRDPPDDLVVIDCVEFNERFRYADPVSDTAFLSMDLLWHGRPGLARRFDAAWTSESGDDEGSMLLPFYRSYRAAVRAKVEGMVTEQKEVPQEERRRAAERARGHWLLALSELADPGERPAMVLVGGLPGTGKSTLAGELGRRAGFRVVSSDVVRKELAGLRGGVPASAAFEEGIYTPEWSRRTYQACLERAQEHLFRGERVLVDASFREEGNRRLFLEAAGRWGVRSRLLLCRAPREVVRRRLRERTGGISDADWQIYRRSARAWEEPALKTRRFVVAVPTGGTREEMLEAALLVLSEAGITG